MNKKTILMAPLAVLAMGLTSCNKGWPTITKDDAAVKERINAVLKEYNETEKVDVPGEGTMDLNFKNLSKTMDINLKNSYSTKYKNHTLNNRTESVINYDLENCYIKRNEVNEKIDEDSGYELTKEETYDIWKEKKSYELNKISYSGKYENVEDVEVWKKVAHANIRDQYNEYVEMIYETVFLETENFDDLLTAWNTFNTEAKKSDGFFNYNFTTNDKTKNIGIIIDAKYKGSMPTSDKAPEGDIVEKIEVRFENNFLTYVKSSMTLKIKEDSETGTPAVETSMVTEGTAKYTSQVAKDSINLDEYVIMPKN